MSSQKARRVTRVSTFYHFTSPDHLPLIERDGFLKLTESNVGGMPGVHTPAGVHVGPDVVWLLDTPVLEYEHGLDGTYHDKKAVRFTVRTRATRWLDWAPAQRMDVDWRRSMVGTAGGMGAARRWWVAESRIMRADWLAVEMVR